MLLCFVVLVTCYVFTLNIFRGIELDRANAKLALYERTIDNELTRLSHLPPVLAEEMLVRMAAIDGQTDTLNKKFENISKSARAEAIYLMDKTGLTIASSNYKETKTFLGQNYGFRPYFKKSLEGKNSTFFAIGATTSRPGFFLSSPVKNEENIIAVLALKLDLTALNKILQSTDDLVMVTNADDIILLSSKPEWRYKSLSPISKTRLQEIAIERQFGREKLDKLKWKETSSNEVTLFNSSYIKASKKLKNGVWTLTYLQKTTVLHERAVIAAAALLLLMIAGTMTLVFWRAKRLRQTLDASQRARVKLQKEIKVRRKAEEELYEAQIELKRTSKMVALGQLAASVTHELGQPISAMKNHITAEEITNSTPPTFLQNLTGIIQRMEHITRQLRFFSMSTEEVTQRVYLNRVATGALKLTAHSLEKENVTLVQSGLENNICVQGSHQRLEQVVINLIQNALKAMAEVKTRTIHISLKVKDEKAVLHVSDTGHGLMGQSVEELTEPFHTTGRSGEGMGLGLAISASIISEHGGMIKAGDNETAGAWFQITLPVVEEPKKTDKIKQEDMAI